MRGTPKNSEVMVWKFLSLRSVILIASVLILASLTAQANLLDPPVKKMTIELTEGTNMMVAPSPDGETIILALQGTLWSMPSSGGEATRLTGWDFEATWPVWSPDGSRIAFQNYNDNQYHIWTMNPDGSDLQQVTDGHWDHREPTWSPDGTKIAFASDRGVQYSSYPQESGNYDIWIIDLQVGGYTQCTNGDTEDHSPAWSLPGAPQNQIAYVSGRRSPYAVYTTDYTNNSCNNMVKVADGLAPTWSPGQNSELVYLNNDYQVMVNTQPVTVDEDVFPFPVGMLPDGGFLYGANGVLKKRTANGGFLTDIDFKAPLTVTRPDRTGKDYNKDHGFYDKSPRDVRGIQSPVLSPDGKRVAFIALNDLWVMDIGKKPKQLTNDTYIDWDPSWSPDGKYIYFASDRHGDIRMDIYRVLVKTGEVTRIPNDQLDAVIFPRASPDGKKVAYVNTAHHLKVCEINELSEECNEILDITGQQSFLGRPTWSPDSDYIAVADSRRLTTRFREGYNLIRIVHVETKENRFYMVGEAPFHLSERYEAGPAWSPDGKWLAFIMSATLHKIEITDDFYPGTNMPILGDVVKLTDHASDMPSWGAVGTATPKIIYMANGVVRTSDADGNWTDIPVKLKYKQAMPHGVTVIHAGFLWDGVSPVLREDVDIMLVDNRIMQIRDHNPKAKPKAKRFIDASDLTVLPGLWDSHLHPRVRDYTGGTWAIMLAYGITSVQSYGCSPYTTFLGKESLESGNIVGPRLFTSFIFDGARSYYAHHRSVMNHDVLELELDRAEEMGYDHLKPYVRSDALQFALIAERAHNMGVPTASHFLSPGIQTGILNNAHLGATNRAGFQWAVSARDEKAYQDVMALFTKDDYHLCSTHGGRYLVGETPELIEDNRFTLLMPPYFAARYVNDAQAPPTPAELARGRRSVVPAVQILQKGGTVSIGTDSPVAAPALGVHMALRSFADPRLGNATNHETLLAATINSAKLIHADHELGTVEVGKIADLVMIDGNPLEDIADLVNVEMVMKNGVIYTIPEILAPYLPKE